MSIDSSLLKNLKVLYVEDELEVIQQMSFFLKKRVGKLIVAENGMNGFELFKNHLPDLVLTDLRMPVMDGMAMIKEIRKISDVPVIVTTAFSDKDIILKAVDLGIDNYILKPLDARELVNILEKTAVKVLRSRGTLLKVRSTAMSIEEKNSLEEKIRNGIARFIKEKTGKGPQNVKAFIHGDSLEVEVMDAFTKMEKTLLGNEKNISIVKYNREILYKDSESELTNFLKDILQWESRLKTVEIDTSKDINRIKFDFI
ncbi:Na-translocating system protein MpsC family protein [Alkalithermobacter paradoxus]|uniref:Stage 0 sporulation protein A homolog n=1 Tax=Alkalithermobacter paradoxus TaxID=29349 RepID=A0A1V4I923_9FIRM|nr:transcriptional regulatory protein CseB [[Clostridium] thermoalcaliphilum]